MTGDTENIQREFEEQRQALGRNVQELQYRVKSMVSWRDQYAQHPWAGAGLAFAGGVLISAMAGHKHWSNGGSQLVAPRRTSTLVDSVLAALTGVAATYAKEFLSAAIPGFRDEYERRTSPKPR